MICRHTFFAAMRLRKAFLRNQPIPSFFKIEAQRGLYIHHIYQFRFFFHIKKKYTANIIFTVYVHNRTAGIFFYEQQKPRPAGFDYSNLRPIFF